MKVKVLRNCLANGQHLTAGTTVTLDDDTAKELIKHGRVASTDKEKATEQRDPEVETRDPAAVREANRASKEAGNDPRESSKQAKDHRSGGH